MSPRWLWPVCALLLPLAQATTDNCVELEAGLRTALATDSLASADSQLKKLETACPGSGQLKSAQRYLTDVIARRANDLVNENRLADGETLLDQAKALSWAVSTVRGDIAAKRKNWKEAALQYGQAYELLLEPTHANTTEIPNLLEIREHLHQLATDAQLVYGKMDTSVTRGGKARGILSAASRGFAVRKTALPVHFETGKASLAQDGLESAAALAIFLRGQTGKIILTGFADPRGSDRMNLELSRRRAHVIAAYLVSQGIDLPMQVIGKGASEPPKTVLPNLTEEEQFARWRRVELELVE